MLGDGLSHESTTASHEFCFDQLQEEATDAARRAYTALRAGKTVLTGKKSNAVGNEEQTVLEIIVKHKNINLQVSEQMQQDAVWELQELNETFLEEIEELRIANKVVVDGASDKWGWSDEDHQLFLKLEKQFSTRSSNAERLRLHMTRLQSSFPMLAIEAIRTHRKFYIEYQRYQTKRKDKLELWKRMIERRSQELEKRFLDEHKALQHRQEMDLKRAERLKTDQARREKKSKTSN